MHEFAPSLRGLHSGLGLDVDDSLDTLFQVAAQHALERAIEADDALEHIAGKNRLAVAFHLLDNLHQDAAGQVVAAFRVDNLEGGFVDHHLPDVRQRHVSAGVSVIQATVGVLLDKTRAVPTITGHTGYLWVDFRSRYGIAISLGRPMVCRARRVLT